MRRKVALVDLDNVVYPFAQVMAHIIAHTTDITHKAEELISLYKHYEIWDDYGIPRGQFDWWWEKGVKNGAVWGTGMKIGPIPGAARALWELSDREWHIHLVTSRMNKFRLHDKAAINTVEWLAEHGIPYRSLSFTEDKHAIQGDAIIDDLPDNLIGHPAPVKILFPAPHNLEWAADPENSERDLQFIHKPVYDKEYDTSAWTEVLEILGDGRA